MGNKIVMWLVGIFGASAGKIIGVFFISMLPIIELRGAIPVGFMLGLDWKTTASLAIIGNLLPIPFILLLLDFVFDLMKKFDFTAKIVNKLEEKALSKSDQVTKYAFWGLCLFVAIPLPGTGAWTGALIASVLKMNKTKAFISIFLGVFIAAVIVSLATYGIIGNIF